MAPRNQYPGRGSLDSASDGFAIVPSDTNDLADVTRALWVGEAGDLNIILVSGVTVLIKGVAAGTLLPLKVSRVLAASTTAGSIVGLL